MSQPSTTTSKPTTHYFPTNPRPDWAPTHRRRISRLTHRRWPPPTGYNSTTDLPPVGHAPTITPQSISSRRFAPAVHTSAQSTNPFPDAHPPNVGDSDMVQPITIWANYASYIVVDLWHSGVAQRNQHPTPHRSATAPPYNYDSTPPYRPPIRRP